MNRRRLKQRLLKWGPTLLGILVCAVPLARSAYFQRQLARLFAQDGPAEQQMARLFAMFTGGALGPVTIVDFDWPYYVAAVLLALIAARFWWLYRPIPLDHCQVCRYDLTGNVTGRCPECGAATVSPGRGERS
ncbi:hypothetical protein LCGC14_0908540 [marine sediment metagenome]|uniref:Uncharacterized protein n=1 Tax=marine sediment metagenome TaxID=412755 RepID=A0A0F9NZ03_9ZZZZ|nr:hypothetical protein [Phycisphaerae bacterium]